MLFVKYYFVKLSRFVGMVFTKSHFLIVSSAMLKTSSRQFSLGAILL